MNRTCAAIAVAAFATLISPVNSFAQSAGGSSAGSGSAAGSPSAGNAGEDPSGAGNSSRLASPPAPGTNSAGTAQPSGSGVTTAGTGTTGPQTNSDAAITEENKIIIAR